ncbi:galactonate dehydratase [Metarhizium robertsii ARSEF 23]|uniref:Galactonate dehydratase n=1 Tax=Metarhizium robertsii (strain ARSEF 23 / ATCC MYA-3075) TaxID=655844 RepID=E9FBH7_METRA|nr:galactonate dehydratase [Metarhizium robertsii ARSEF 23]EFY94915.1 galactonate dehydratase [Metarhizium robertsii ARSEF 23]
MEHVPPRSSGAGAGEHRSSQLIITSNPKRTISRTSAVTNHTTHPTPRMGKIAKIEYFRVPPRWLFVKITDQDNNTGWGEASLEGHTQAVEGCLDAWREQYTGLEAERRPAVRRRASRVSTPHPIQRRQHSAPSPDKNPQPRPQGPGLHGRQDERHLGHGLARLARPASELRRARAGRQGARARRRRRLPRPAAPPHGEAARRAAGAPAAALHRGAPAPGAHRGRPRARQVGAGRQLGGKAAVPVALGERLHSRWDAKPFLEASCVDVLQPDVCHVGGISELRRIAAMAEAYDVPIAPHCPLGPVALAACLQVAAATPNFAIQEMSLGIHYNVGGYDLLSYITNPHIWDVKDGYVELMDGPGLGISVNEQLVREASKGAEAWVSPGFVGPGGELREW